MRWLAIAAYRAEHPPKLARWCTPRWEATCRRRWRLPAKKRPLFNCSIRVHQLSAVEPIRSRIPDSSAEMKAFFFAFLAFRVFAFLCLSSFSALGCDQSVNLEIGVLGRSHRRLPIFGAYSTKRLLKVDILGAVILSASRRTSKGGAFVHHRQPLFYRITTGALQAVAGACPEAELVTGSSYGELTATDHGRHLNGPYNNLSFVLPENC